MPSGRKEGGKVVIKGGSGERECTLVIDEEEGRSILSCRAIKERYEVPAPVLLPTEIIAEIKISSEFDKSPFSIREWLEFLDDMWKIHSSSQKPTLGELKKEVRHFDKFIGPVADWLDESCRLQWLDCYYWCHSIQMEFKCPLPEELNLSRKWMEG